MKLRLVEIVTITAALMLCFSMIGKPGSGIGANLWGEIQVDLLGLTPIPLDTPAPVVTAEPDPIEINDPVQMLSCRYVYRPLEDAAGDEIAQVVDLNDQRLVLGSTCSLSDQGICLNRSRAILWDDSGQIAFMSDTALETSLLPEALDNRGRFAGRTESENFRAFYTDQTGQMTYLPAPAGASPEAEMLVRDMNNVGNIVGIYRDPVLGKESVFLYNSRTQTTRLIPGEDVRAINNRGDILITEENGGAALLRPVRNSLEFERIALPASGHALVFPMALTDYGDVLFFHWDFGDSPKTSMIRTGSGDLISLPAFPGRQNVVGISINDALEVVGNACRTTEGPADCVPFLYKEGQIFDGSSLMMRRPAAFFKKINSGGDILIWNGQDTPDALLMCERTEG